MPRPNPGRTVLAEERLAARIRHERERRGWSYDSLASRMGAVGSKINPSGIYKIEQGQPRRRITVDELVGFSKVFEVPVEELLLPPDIAVSREAVGAFREWVKANQELGQAAGRRDAAYTRLAELLATNPAVEPKIREQLLQYAQEMFPEHPDLAEARAQWDLAYLRGDEDLPVVELTTALARAAERERQAAEDSALEGGDGGGQHPEAP